MKKIYYQFTFEQEGSTLLLLKDLLLNGVFRILIKELPTEFTTSFLHNLAGLKSEGLELILSYSPERLEKLSPFGVVVDDDYDVIDQLRKDHPQLLLCMAANSVVACKNGELAGVNELFVDLQKFRTSSLQPKGLIGQEAVENFYPAKEGYGWVFLTLNTALVIDGIQSLHQMKAVFADTDCTAILLSETFESTLSLQEKIHAVNTILL